MRKLLDYYQIEIGVTISCPQDDFEQQQRKGRLLFQASSKKDRYFPGGLYYLIPTDQEEKSMSDVAEQTADPGIKRLVTMSHYTPR